MNFTKPHQSEAKITSKEMERRRAVVRGGVAENRIEGIARDPAADPIFDAYIRGEIDARDMVPLLNKLRSVARS